MSMLEELWISGLDYQGRPVKKGSAMERKMVLYAKNTEKMKAMLSDQQLEQYEKTIDAFNEVAAQSELEAFELGFTLAARLMILEALEVEPLKWRALVHLLIVTGCRRGEILGLKWDKIDLEAGKARIDTTLLYAKDRGLYESTTKTGNIRTVGLPKETVQLLREWRKECLVLRLENGDRWHNTGYVFIRDDGQPMHPDSIAHWLRAFSERHGLPHINAHAFRHTVASVLIANGTDVVTVSKQLGHLDVSTTETFYSHIIEENKQRATECIADALLRKKQA